MVWKLGDLCLECVQKNLEYYPHLGQSLPTVFKELLIERLACHDRFFPEHLNHININLFSKTLRHIDLQRLVLQISLNKIIKDRKIVGWVGLDKYVYIHVYKYSFIIT